MPSLNSYNYDLTGLIDIHIHTSPDVAPRRVNDLEAAQDARAAGMRAILIKSHVTCTADRATVVEKAVGGIRVFGGLALNDPVGGLNPYAVDAALRLGAKAIWMPTQDAAHGCQVKGKSGGIEILIPGGELKSRVGPILELIRDADVILGTGHISIPEIIALVGLARQMGLRKILVTHPESRSARMSLDIQQQIAGESVFFERCFLPVTSGQTSLDEIIAGIRAVGISSTVLATDLGQPENPKPTDGLRAFSSQLESKGVTRQDIVQMAGRTPAYLLDL
jgi:hypothetical protein